MSDIYDLDVVVVGAGVIGLAVGRALAQEGREVTVLERHPGHGQETSSRNSEVVHAGIYYPPDTLKAKLCVQGKALLYDYCHGRGIPARQCGKLIVASGAEAEEKLSALLDRGRTNGVSDLKLLSRAEAAALEPEVVCDLALLSPSSGIVDSHGYMSALVAQIEGGGGRVVGNTEVAAIEPTGRGFVVRLRGDESIFRCRVVINAAGLHAAEVAARTAGLDPSAIPTIRFARGCYFALQGGRPPFRHLVYPLPDSASLGVHATLDLGGRVRFGPDVEWIDTRDDYAVDRCRADRFYEAIRRYWPALPNGSLTPDYAGIRPKLSGPGEPPADFRIDDRAVHGLPGLVCLYGIESPGLTASLAIGEHVASRVREDV